MDKFWKNAQVYGRRSKNWQPRKSYAANKTNYELFPLNKAFSGDINDVCSQILTLIRHRKESSVEVVFSNYSKFYERQEHLVKVTIPRERNRTIFYEFYYRNGKWTFGKVKNQ